MTYIVQTAAPLGVAVSHLVIVISRRGGQISGGQGREGGRNGMELDRRVGNRM